jgi:fumarylacetoacetate (FAA) hydrolase
VKLATLRSADPDGKLILVSRDLDRARVAGDAAPTMRSAIENWTAVEAELRRLSAELNASAAADAFDLEPTALSAPLPRAFQWLDASAFHNHGDLVEKALGIPALPDRREIPLMYQGAGDDFLGPNQDVPLPSTDHQIDFEAEVGVIIDRVAMGTTAEAALRHVKLLVLINDWSLRLFSTREGKTSFGFLQAKPSTSFAPCAVTPDELGNAGWSNGKIRHSVRVSWNDRQFGRLDCSQMGFSFAELIAHAAHTRNLTAGTIIGSGTVSNQEYLDVGSGCIAEQQAIEMIHHGAVKTAYLQFNDRVRIDILDEGGRSIFGVIDQRVVMAAAPQI